MKVTVHERVDDFLRLAEEDLAQHEPLSTMVFGLALEIQRKERAGEPLGLPGRRFFVSAVGNDGLSFAAVQAPPYGFVVFGAFGGATRATEEAGEAAISAVLDTLHAAEYVPPSIVGPKPLVEALAEAWIRRYGDSMRARHRLRLYELRQVTASRSRPGCLRLATADDEATVGDWFYAFNLEAIGIDDMASARVMARRRIEAAEVFLWDQDGARCMAARARGTQRSIAVGHVYTPPTERGQGVASACVAALSQLLLDEGFSCCTLFTDLDNPTSNKIYQQVGYRPVADFREVVFETESPP